MVLSENNYLVGKLCTTGLSGVLLFSLATEHCKKTIVGHPSVEIQRILRNRATISIGETSLRLGEISCGTTKASEPYNRIIAISVQVQTLGAIDLYPAMIQTDPNIPTEITPLITDRSKSVVATYPTSIVNQII